MLQGTPFDITLLGVAVLLLVSVLASKVSSSRLSVPALAIFLGVGMLAGSEGIGRVHFDNHQFAQNLGVVALLYILFSGGVDTDTAPIKKVILPSILLSTVGVFMSAVLVGVFVVYFLKFTVLEGLLLGSIISSTDAAAVFSILRSKNVHLKPELKGLLEFESGSNDPMAIFLTTMFIQIIQSPGMPLGNFFIFFVQQMALGIFLGVMCSEVMKRILENLELSYRGLYPAFTLGMVLLTYALTAALGGNGFLAVYICGLNLALSDFRYKKGLIVFHDSIAWIMQILVFVTLGLLSVPSHLIGVWHSGIIVALVLFFVARPLSVVTCLAWFKMPKKEIAMTSWVGLRGAAPIVLATFPLAAGIDRARDMFDIIFFVVLLSVIIQGSSIDYMAKKLGVALPPPEPEPEK